MAKKMATKQEGPKKKGCGAGYTHEWHYESIERDNEEVPLKPSSVWKVSKGLKNGSATFEYDSTKVSVTPKKNFVLAPGPGSMYWWFYPSGMTSCCLI